MTADNAGNFTLAACNTLMALLAVTVCQVGTEDRQTLSKKERREAVVEPLLKCVCIWVGGFII